MRFGYACINLSLAKEGIQVSRSMIKRTFQEKGIAYASELAMLNILDLEKIIFWNISNNLLLYRMSSNMFPWMSEYELTDLPHFEKISCILERCGDKAKKGGLRLTFHPGPYNVLASPSESAFIKTLKDLRQHAEILDLLRAPNNCFSKINIHMGGAYGDKKKTLETFAENFQLLPRNVANRLTIENDDKKNMFSIKDLLLLHNMIKIPIVFDYLHHRVYSGGWDEQDAFFAAIETWPSGITPVVHYSSSKKEYEDQKAPPAAHADYIYEHINTYDKDVDVMLEAKAKDWAVIKYLKDFIHG